MRRFAVTALLVALLAGLFGFARGEYDMPYYIVVDISCQIVTVYETATQQIVRQMVCSTGRTDNTPEGTFTMQKARNRFDRAPWYRIDDQYVRFPSRIYGEILFHSLPYSRKSLQAIDREALEQLGYPSSHGCVRMRWQDAEFIARNCLPGTGVRIVKSGERNDALRELLLAGSYDAATGIPYDNFLGSTDAPGALGRASAGQAVLDLQYRLRDLGFYGGELNGVYGGETVNAVRAAQRRMDADMSGAATAEFLEAIYSDDAPTDMLVALEEGRSGPAVKRLQRSLIALRLMDGEADGIYDADVAAAVAQFQRAYGWEPDGAAEPEVQRAIEHEAAQVEAILGGTEYGCEWIGEKLTVARVNARAGIKLREGPSQHSPQLKSLSVGALLLVLNRGKEWVEVRSGSSEGYVSNDLVEFREGEVGALRYASADGAKTYLLGHTAREYVDGARLPRDEFEDVGSASPAGLAYYATVDTRGEAERLNLRQQPDIESAVLDTVENGVTLRVRRRLEGWTQVIRDGVEGYLMNDYLAFKTGPADLLGEAEVAGEPRRARVSSVTPEKAAVYAEPADDGEILGRLPDGTLLSAWAPENGWCRVRHEDRTGYMLAEELMTED